MSYESLMLNHRGDEEKDRKLELDFISKVSGFGAVSGAQSSNLGRINAGKLSGMSLKNRDNVGYTFFTRPDLNLTDGNISNFRMFTPLINSSPDSMVTALKCMLDPRSERRFESPTISNIFDSKQAFLPVLSNNLININGWPDLAVDTYTSKEGNFKESYSMVDGTSHIFNTFDVTANFKNIQGDPITLLFVIWVYYQSLVYDGTLVPYPDMILKKEIDYNTRIYRLVMDVTNTYVQKIGCCGAGFPMASPIGASFNYSNETPFNTENDQISVPFRCIGFNYLDPILVREFNQTVIDKNNSMDSQVRPSLMAKIGNRFMVEPYGNIGTLMKKYLNDKVYPRIDPITMELEWYATIEDVNDAINELKDNGVLR